MGVGLVGWLASYNCWNVSNSFHIMISSEKHGILDQHDVGTFFGRETPARTTYIFQKSNATSCGNEWISNLLFQNRLSNLTLQGEPLSLQLGAILPLSMALLCINCFPLGHICYIVISYNPFFYRS